MIFQKMVINRLKWTLGVAILRTKQREILDPELIVSMLCISIIDIMIGLNINKLEEKRNEVCR